MSTKINYNNKQKEKELKIINYYKKLGELSTKGLEKTKPIKRTRKNLQNITIQKIEENIGINDKKDKNQYFIALD